MLEHRFQAPDGHLLNVDDAGGGGLPVVFQHGLCGEVSQTREAFPADPAFRRITVEMRGHGASEAGNPVAFSMAAFCDDLAAFINTSGLAPVVVGGISMGAAIALRLAVKRPELVRGLILARPAWVTASSPDNMKPNAEAGALLARLPQADAFDAFMAGTAASELAKHAPDNLASLKGFFARDPQAVTAALLQRISADGPEVTEVEVRAVDLPTLIIGHERDAIHPLAHAHALHRMIRHSRLSEITPKAVDKARYLTDFHSAVRAFLKDL